MPRFLSNPEALARVQGELHAYGITRVARQTDLDTIGVPCFAAIRPNSRTLAVNQGKGGDDVAAQLSAIMEAIEFAVAEDPRADATFASIDELTAGGIDWFVPTRALPRRHAIGNNTRLTWLTGRSLASARSVLVPLDSVALAPATGDGLPFAQSSNGLGAGFNADDAIAHALCEVIERDASSLWSLRTSRFCASTEMGVGAMDHHEAIGALKQVLDAGFRLKLFDLTSDLGMPVVMALLWSGKPRGFFDVASGICAHPNAHRAVAGAIEEATQTRVSNISGARDDIDPAEYDMPLPRWILDLVETRGARDHPMPPSMSAERFAAMPKLMGPRTIAVPLSRQGETVCVVKVMSDAMEDRSTNMHWRPGPRAKRIMTTL